MLTEHRAIVNAERRERWAVRDKHEKEIAGYARQLKEISKFMRLAWAQDYLLWVQGYLALGGKITRHYDYDLPSNFFVALGSFSLPPLCGATSRNVIVPAGLDVTPAGHCVVYRMGDFSASPGHFPMYNDIARMLG